MSHIQTVTDNFNLKYQWVELRVHCQVCNADWETRRPRGWCSAICPHCNTVHRLNWPHVDVVINSNIPAFVPKRRSPIMRGVIYWFKVIRCCFFHQPSRIRTGRRHIGRATIWEEVMCEKCGLESERIRFIL